MSKFTGLMLAMPAYQGVHARTALSLWNTAQHFKEHDIRCDLAIKSGSALVGDARNHLVAGFLALGAQHFTHLLFVDSDLSWTSEDALKFVMRQLLSDVPIACGTYRKKFQDLGNRAYAVNFEDVPEPVQNEHGLLRVRMGPGGWICIRRDALEQMVAAYPELRVRDDPGMPPECEEYHYDLFGHVHLEDGRKLSEDYSFGYRWEQLGGQVWLDPNLKLDHWGTYCWEHNVAEDCFTLKSDSADGSSAA